MTYQYECVKCGHNFDVIKSVKDIDVNEFCTRCESPAVRKFVPENIYFSGAKVTHAEFNPGLGCVVKNEAHKKDLLKRKGLVEVGNDFKSGESMQKDFDQKRADRLSRSYDDI